MLNSFDVIHQSFIDYIKSDFFRIMDLKKNKKGRLRKDYKN